MADGHMQAAAALALRYEAAWRDAEQRARPHLLRDLMRSAAVWGPVAALLGILAVLN